MRDASTLRFTILADPPGEGWTSMDLCAEMLEDGLTRWASGPRFGEVTRVAPGLPRVVRRLPRVGSRNAAFNADRMLTRFGLYPLEVLRQRTRADVFHIPDQSYAQLAFALPAERTGVFCHDLDAFRCLVEPAKEPRPAWFRAMSRVQLSGLQRAAVVFYATQAIGDELLRHRLVEERRLVHAPLGTAPEFTPDGPAALPPEVAALGGAPYLLHVGSSAPRKRLDVLFAAFAEVRRHFPDLRLVQQGGALTPELRAQAEALGIGTALVQPPKQPRETLAALYRNARLVLQPSDGEGFGLPVVEALACGAPVVASDIPVFREVGADAVTFAPRGEAAEWAPLVRGLLERPDSAPSRARRLEVAGRYSWKTHAETIRDTYLRLV
ncbi:glycosyltransferase [Myxococcaceae bacterium GXIMD 01537]